MLLDRLYQLLELCAAARAELGHLFQIEPGDGVQRVPFAPGARDSRGRHGEARVDFAVDEFENRRLGLVLVVAVDGLDAQDARVAAGSVGISLAELTKEFGEELVGCLFFFVSVGKGGISN